MLKLILRLLCTWLLCIFSYACFATNFYVSSTGASSGPGSFNSPWALPFALNRPANVVKPGDTIYIRGGVYIGTFISTISGSIEKPVVVCNYPNERVTLRGNPVIGENEVTLEIDGFSTCFIGLEVTSNTGQRKSFNTDDPPADLYTANGIYVHGEYTKVINCTIHDCPGTGIGFWSDALDAEVYGCLIYNNGYSNANRGHGPSVYIQNSDASRPKALRNNFIFNGFSVGIQFYAFADVLKGVTLDSNTVFNAAALTTATQGRRANLLAGGENAGAGARVRNFKVRDNVFYRDTADNTFPQYMQYSSIRKNVELGYQDEALYDVDIDFSRNHVFGDPTPILLHRWDSGVFKYNTLYAYQSNYPDVRRLFEHENETYPFANWDSNYYYTNLPGYTTPFSDKTFASWKQAYGVDSHSVFINTGPTANSYQIRKNRQEPHKYYVTVMNYVNADTITLPLIDAALTGCSYAVFDVQQSWRVPVDTGLYSSGNFRLLMNTSQVAQAVGIIPSPPKHTGRTLGTFIIEFYPEIFTIKNGDWNDATVWNTGKVPAYYNRVTINHPVTATQNAWCKSVKAITGSVTVAPGVLINIGQQ